MADQAPGTKPVRVVSETATKLQTIASLCDQMGERFKVSEYLQTLIGKAVDELFDVKVKAFNDYLAAKKKPKPRT